MLWDARDRRARDGYARGARRRCVRKIASFERGAFAAGARARTSTAGRMTDFPGLRGTCASAGGGAISLPLAGRAAIRARTSARRAFKGVQSRAGKSVVVFWIW